MSPQLLEQNAERMDSRQKFLELYKFITDTLKEIVPLEKRVFPVFDEYKKKLDEGKISKFDLHLNPELRDLKDNINELDALHEKLERTSNAIRELRSKLSPAERENEVNAIIESKTYLQIEQMRVHSRMMSSATPQERMKHADEMEGLYRADVTIEEFNTEMKGELKK